jgi:prevent-host-death family protein
MVSSTAPWRSTPPSWLDFEVNSKQPGSGSIKKDAKMMRGDMIDISQDIHSLTTFKRDTATLIKRMKKSGRPLVLTVKGRAEAVVMDAASYQRLWDRVDAMEGIRRGLIQAKKGMGRPLEEVLDAIEKNRQNNTE